MPKSMPKTAATWPATAIEMWPISRITADPRNTRRHADGQIDAIRASIREFGVTFPALVRETGQLIAGEGRWTAGKAEGLREFPVIVARGWSDAQCRAYSIADNRLTDLSEFDIDALKSELTALRDEGFAIDLTGFAADDLETMLAAVVAGNDPGGGAGSLAAKFGIPPFSVLNAREGWWQDRKRAWLALGIQSELGRGAEAWAERGRKANAVPGGGKDAAGPGGLRAGGGKSNAGRIANAGG
jgi:hypothetical protein